MCDAIGKRVLIWELLICADLQHSLLKCVHEHNMQLWSAFMNTFMSKTCNCEARSWTQHSLVKHVHEHNIRWCSAFMNTFRSTTFTNEAALRTRYYIHWYRQNTIKEGEVWYAYLNLFYMWSWLYNNLHKTEFVKEIDMCDVLFVLFTRPYSDKWYIYVFMLLPLHPFMSHFAVKSYAVENILVLQITTIFLHYR